MKTETMQKSDIPQVGGARWADFFDKLDGKKAMRITFDSHYESLQLRMRIKGFATQYNKSKGSTTGRIYTRTDKDGKIPILYIWKQT